MSTKFELGQKAAVKGYLMSPGIITDVHQHIGRITTYRVSTYAGEVEEYNIVEVSDTVMVEILRSSAEEYASIHPSRSTGITLTDMIAACRKALGRE